jgi:hypothetical protein
MNSKQIRESMTVNDLLYRFFSNLDFHFEGHHYCGWTVNILHKFYGDIFIVSELWFFRAFFRALWLMDKSFLMGFGFVLFMSLGLFG